MMATHTITVTVEYDDAETTEVNVVHVAHALYRELLVPWIPPNVEVTVNWGGDS